MVFENTTLLAGIVLIFVILIIVLCLVLYKQITKKNRLDLMRAYTGAPRKTPGSPVLVHGPAGSPGVIPPTGGEPVAFHATFIMSRGCTLIRDPDNRKPLPDYTSFKVFTMSGNFSVTEAGIPYTISIISALERINDGAAGFTKQYKQTIVLDGMPDSVFDDMVTFEAASQALVPVFSLTDTGGSVTSSIDSRVSRFVHGRDVPPAIADILKGKIIRPQPGEEITVVEFYIPQKKSVWVFGEFDGKNTVWYGEDGAGLSVSYADPETAGVEG
jgi:hypothetical protein